MERIIPYLKHIYTSSLINYRLTHTYFDETIEGSIFTINPQIAIIAACTEKQNISPYY